MFKKKIHTYFYELNSVPTYLTSIFILSLIGMNLLANKSIDTKIQWLALDCGILLSGICFLAMDLITFIYGKRKANIVSVFALILSFCFSIFLSIASYIPGLWAESFAISDQNIINNALDNTFRGTWYIIVASSFAFITSSFFNNFLNEKIGRHSKTVPALKAFVVRSYISTFLAQVLDNMIFALIVSKMFFSWTYLQCISCSVTGALIELFSEVFISPFAYRIIKGSKH